MNEKEPKIHHVLCWCDSTGHFHTLERKTQNGVIVVPDDPEESPLDKFLKEE